VLNLYNILITLILENSSSIVFRNQDARIRAWHRRMLAFLSIPLGVPPPMTDPNVVVVIPARYASTRLPGKPLVPLAGKPMIQHVYERAKRAQTVHRVLVATDDQRILDAVQSFGGEARMPRASGRFASINSRADENVST
jgi:hypothetical protein